MSSRIYKYQAHGYAFSGVEELLYSLGESAFVNMTQRSVAESLLQVGVTQRFIDDVVSAVLRASYGQSAAMPAFAGEPLPSACLLPFPGPQHPPHPPPVSTPHPPGSVQLSKHIPASTLFDSGIGPPGCQEMMFTPFLRWWKQSSALSSSVFPPLLLGLVSEPGLLGPAGVYITCHPPAQARALLSSPPPNVEGASSVLGPRLNYSHFHPPTPKHDFQP